MNWYEETWQNTVKILNTDSECGLTEQNVKKIQKQYGKNKLDEKKKNPMIIKFLLQFNDFMIFILLLAAAVSFFVSFAAGERDFLDTFIIIFIVIVNAVLGLVQENKAEKSLEALKNMQKPTAKVIRMGRIVDISTEELVPGDIILLKTGDFVPADARLIETDSLKVEESALTGESLSVEKDASGTFLPTTIVADRLNMVYLGTSISRGKAKAVVTATAMDTEIGRIAHMLLEKAPATPLQKKLEKTGKYLGIGALLICIVIFALGTLQGADLFTMFMTSVSLAVAAIPEGLPAIVTITLAIGVQRMVKQKAVIRKLPAVETLGGATIICSDKTGTLTQNKMKVVEIANGDGVLWQKSKLREIILTYASLCSDAILQKDKAVGEPTETAIVQGAYLQGINKNELDKIYKKIGGIPFDSKRKLMSTVHKNDENKLVIVKGAPDILLEKCTYYYKDGKSWPINDQLKKILAQNNKMAKKALRVLAVAYKNIEGKGKDNNIEENLIFLGLIGIIDPPRAEAKEAVSLCKKAGIRPIMITGDHIITATAIAKELGIIEDKEKAMTGKALSMLSEDELLDIIDDYRVFARVSPEHKVQIVKAYQQKGNIVAMTGDGVNDAPALKAADIGCAMGITGTDVAKGAADMVLLDDNFATITKAVKEGRGIYTNIKKAIHFLLSSNVGEIFAILITLLLGWPTPLLAIHLLWVNLVTDSLPAIALGFEKTDDNVMTKKPIKQQASFFAGGLWQRIGLEGLMIGLLAVIAFGVGRVYFDSPGEYIVARTMAFATLSIAQLVHAFNVRAEKGILQSDFLGNKYLIYAFIAGVLLQVSVISIEVISSAFRVVPLESSQWLVVAFLSLMPIVIIESQKFFQKAARK